MNKINGQTHTNLETEEKSPEQKIRCEGQNIMLETEITQGAVAAGVEIARASGLLSETALRTSEIAAPGLDPVNGLVLDILKLSNRTGAAAGSRR